MSKPENGPYEAVYTSPDGESTVARQARTAARQGYDGIVVRTRDAAIPDGIVERYGVDPVAAVEIDADDPASASGALGGVRPEYPVVLVRGGTAAMNRFAVEQPRVDVLASPTGHGEGADRFDHVAARAAARNGVRVEFDLGPVLRSGGRRRVRAIADLRLLADLVEKYDAPHVVSARAASHLALRAPRELVAVGEAVGLEGAFVRAGLAEWGRLVERNRERTGDDFVMPGVRRGRHGARSTDDDTADDGTTDDGPPADGSAIGGTESTADANDGGDA